MRFRVDGVHMAPSKVVLSRSAAMGSPGRPAHAAPPSKATPSGRY